MTIESRISGCGHTYVFRFDRDAVWAVTKEIWNLDLPKIDRTTAIDEIFAQCKTLGWTKGPWDTDAKN